MEEVAKLYPYQTECPPGKSFVVAPLAAPSPFMPHGVALWTAWCIFGMSQIISHRYLKHYWRYSLWIHILGGIFILTTTLWYGFYGLWKMGGAIAPDPHAKLGLTVASTVVVLVASGLTSRVQLATSLEDQKNMLFWKMAHKVILPSLVNQILYLSRYLRTLS